VSAEIAAPEPVLRAEKLQLATPSGTVRAQGSLTLNAPGGDRALLLADLLPLFCPEGEVELP